MLVSKISLASEFFEKIFVEKSLSTREKKYLRNVIFVKFRKTYEAKCSKKLTFSISKPIFIYLLNAGSVLSLITGNLFCV